MPGNAEPAEAPRLGSRSGVLNPTGACRPARPSGRQDSTLRAVAEEWPLGGDLRRAGLRWPAYRRRVLAACDRLR